MSELAETKDRSRSPNGVDAAPRSLRGPLRPLLLSALAAVAFAATGVLVPAAIGSALLMTLLVQATTNAVFATSIGTLLRMNGVVSFGHVAFYGLAAYIVALGLSRTNMGLELAVALALIAPTALAFLLGLVIVGIPGTAFSMMTVAVGQGLYEFAMRARAVTGGEDGFDLQLPPRFLGMDTSLLQTPRTMFVLCWIILVLVVFGLAVLIRSPFGRVAIAIRENEERARFVGYHTRVHRTLVFALSAFIAAIAGVLSVLYSAYISPDALNWSVSGSVLVMVIIGGPELLWGPAFGAIIFFFLKDIFGDYTEHWQALIGIMLIVVTLLIPQGLGGLLSDRFRALAGRNRS